MLTASRTGNENAGIDRKIAISLLVTNEKIVLIATHDPVLALSAERRMVIKNGTNLSVDASFMSSSGHRGDAVEQICAALYRKRCKKRSAEHI